MRVEVKLPKPHPAQQTVLDSKARFMVMMCGRRFGKSLISQSISIDDAIIKKRVGYVTPTYKLGKVFFKEILRLIPEEIRTKNESDLLIETITGGSIRFFTGENLDAFRGHKFHKVIIDEAAYISNLEEAWNNSIRPTLTDYRGDALFLSTPKGKNYFYSMFMRGGEKDWQSFKFTTYDNPHIDPEEIEAARIQLPHAVFEQEYMANPMQNAANPFGIDYIAACVRPLSTLKSKFFGIDLAKSIDWTVIIGLDENGHVCYFDRFQKDWKQTREAILRLDRNTPVMIDSTGVGDAITEDLQREFNSMFGFKYTSTTKQQLMENLASVIHKGEIGFPAGAIKDELEIFEYQYRPTGVRYTAPEGFHDDCVNALALANKCRQDHKFRGIYHVI